MPFRSHTMSVTFPALFTSQFRRSLPIPAILGNFPLPLPIHPRSSQVIPVWRGLQPFHRVPQPALSDPELAKGESNGCPLWLKVLVFRSPDVPITRSPDLPPPPSPFIPNHPRSSQFGVELREASGLASSQLLEASSSVLTFPHWKEKTQLYRLFA